MSIEYREDTSTIEVIISHFENCDEDFIAGLVKKIDINEYSKKIFDNAKRFEAWYGDSLAGLAALYINENDFLYLTNISVNKDFTGRKIASTLLEQCIVFARKQKAELIRLEVEKQNIPAIRLYEKFNFRVVETSAGAQFMERKL